MKNYATRVLGVSILLTLVAACASNNYASVTPGVTSFGKVRVTIGEGWLRAPAGLVPEERSSSRTLSRDDVERDRLMIIPGVSVGESIFKNQDDASPLPLFAANMDPEEIAAMVGQSMQQALWNGSATVAVKDAREQGYGYDTIAGFAFNLEVDMSGGPNQKAVAGGFVYEDRLFVTIYTAESPGEYESQIDVAQALIDSASVRIKTIQFR